MHNNHLKSKAFTLAETLITLAIIGIIAVLAMYMLNSDKIRQRELLGRFHITFAKLDNLVGLTSQASRNYDDWRADANSLANLTCTDDSGSNVSNKSICLKKALLSASSIPQDCSEPDKCFKNYDKLTEQLKSIFPSFKSNDSIAFTLPGGVQVLGSYLDSTCELEIPIGRGRDNSIEKVKGCGFLLADVNGNSKPNNLLIGDDKIIDRFLMAITPNGLVKSNLLDEIAGCPSGTTYDATTKECVGAFSCPLDMDYMKELQNKNSEDLLILEYPYGAEHSDCYEVKCKSGDAPDSENKCPELCSASDEKRYGGLWLSEGGDLPDKWSEKACCVPITNQAELAAINTDSNSLSRDYCLMSDINFNKNGAGSTSSEGWTPIGSQSAPFKGSFYGNGHKISNLYINKSSSTYDYVGLFGKISNPSTYHPFKDLEIESGEITTQNSQYTGSIIGYGEYIRAKNLVNSANINVTNTLNSLNYLGGVAGSLYEYFSNAKNIGNLNITLKPNNTSYTALIDLPDSQPDIAGPRMHANGISGLSTSSEPMKNFINIGNIQINENGHFSEEPSEVYIGGIMESYTTITNAINAGNIKLVKDSNIPLIVKFLFNLSGIGLLTSTKSSINTGDITFLGAEENTYYDSIYISGISSTAYSNQSSINTGNINLESASYENAINKLAHGSFGNNSINLGEIIGSSFSSGVSLSSIDSTGSNINAGNVSSKSPKNVNAFSSNISTNSTNLYNLTNINATLGSNLANAFYLSGSVTGCTTAGDYTGCSEILASDIKKAATYSAISSDSENAQYWSIIDGFFPTLKASVMPPQIFRDCRNNKTPYGGCYDVLNTPNAFMPDFGTTNPIGVEDYKPFIMWAWKKPTTNTTPIEYPVLRWQCKPYRLNGYDCCRPSYATWEPKLPACPALVIPSGADYRSIN